MKRYRIRKYSLLWWAGKIGQAALLGAVEWAVIIGLLTLYSSQTGLPMPWEGLI